jgi:hypothetical protein
MRKQNQKGIERIRPRHIPVRYACSVSTSARKIPSKHQVAMAKNSILFTIIQQPTSDGLVQSNRQCFLPFLHRKTVFLVVVVVVAIFTCFNRTLFCYPSKKDLNKLLSSNLNSSLYPLRLCIRNK